MNNDNEKNKYTDEKTGRFKEGNPGRPYGAKSHLKQLEEALEAEAKKQNKTYYEKLAEWCFMRPAVAMAILKKFVPDKSYMEIKGDLKQPTIDLSGLSTEEVRALAYGYKIKKKPTKKQKELSENKERKM